MQGITHIIGAGLAGLSAATRLAAEGRKVVVYEAAGLAGGRCRSYHDETFGAVIDNGNHLLLSGNTSALAYLQRIDTHHIFNTFRNPVFYFADDQSKERWTLQLNQGRIPFWILNRNKRVPGTRITDYFSVKRLLNARPEQTVTSLLNPQTLLFQRLWHPVLLAALNTELTEASAQLAGAVLRDTLLEGGNACIPIVTEGLSSAFIDPALTYLSQRDVPVQCNHRVRNICFEDGKAATLEFMEGDAVQLSASDTIVCATPPWVAASLLPDIRVPDAYRAILNVHFRITPPPSLPAILGIIHATSEWLFAFPDRISVTVSNADRLMSEDRDVLAQQIWNEIAGITGLANTLPPWQIVKEKRATFAATPEQDARRPGSLTKWPNIYLAGDYVQTGLPATIESAVRSGEKAAEYVMKKV